MRRKTKVFGMDVYEMDEELWYYKPLIVVYKTKRFLSEIYSYFKSRFFTKLHIIRLPLSFMTADADDRMFEACFRILGRYVEEELGTDIYYGELYRGYRLDTEKDSLAIDLWLWYKIELPILEKTEENPNVIETIKDKRLRELMNIRRNLWT